MTLPLLHRPLVARSFFFLAALMPMAAWLVSNGKLARPFETFSWSLLLALLTASVPAKLTKPLLWVHLLVLPATLSWMGAVVVTGMPPSMGSLESIIQGAFKEVIDAATVALRDGRFQALCTVYLWLLFIAWRVVRPAALVGGNLTNAVFLVLLLPSFVLVADLAGMKSLARLLGPEARMSVVWINQLEASKELLARSIDRLAMPPVEGKASVRHVNEATAAFKAEKGVAVFMVGDSMRADALMVEGRGPYSTALKQRLSEGLGATLGNACAGGNGTFTSFPKLITFSEGVDPASAEGRPTLLAIAKAAGAKTAYINNHEIWVVPELGHDLNQKLSTVNSTVYDEMAVDAMGDFIAREKSESLAILLHLYGQHFFYQDRYPASLFGPEAGNLSKEALDEFRYHRAAEYGVYVLLKAMEVLDQLDAPAYLVFTSDHGENLPSDGTGKTFHAGPVNGRHDTYVPALVLWNRAFRDSDRFQRVTKLHRDDETFGAPIAHRDLAQLWLRLMGHTTLTFSNEAPMTWGSLRVGERSGPIRCDALRD